MHTNDEDFASVCLLDFVLGIERVWLGWEKNTHTNKQINKHTHARARAHTHTHIQETKKHSENADTSTSLKSDLDC